MLNAAGRLEDADMAVKFLLSNDQQEAEKMAKKLDATNILRREKEGEMLVTALALAEKQKHNPALILTSPEFHEGINGIVATRLVERFYKPVLILSEREEKLKGSGRSIPELTFEGCTCGMCGFAGTFRGTRRRCRLQITFRKI